jgi:precorrin-4 C11-methyltransferase
MTVYFVGAGPGDPDLITIRGRDLIAKCQVCLYAGSLVPKEIVAFAPNGALIKDTAAMNLIEIIDEIKDAHAKGKDVARVHSGDPSIYGAIAEQMRMLDKHGISYNVTPGVPSYVAAAAELKQELTLPEVSQTIIATRTTMHASAMPEGEELAKLGASRATLAIHLSIRNLKHIQDTLIQYYGADCPVIVAYRVTWPDQKFIQGTLADIRQKVRDAKISRTALILVGRVFDNCHFRDSSLYDPEHFHVLRPKKKAMKK